MLTLANYKSDLKAFKMFEFYADVLKTWRNIKIH